MDFRKVTPASINYLKTVSITEQARLYLKLTKLHRVAVQNVWFNQQCKHLNVIPNYINISTNSRTYAAKKALKKAENIWLNEESRYWFTIRDNLKTHLKILYSELSFSLHNVEFDLLDCKARDFASIEAHRKYLIQLKKLNSLTRDSSYRNFNNSSHIQNPHNFDSRVKNLTDVNFPQTEISLLEKGLKYNLKPNFSKTSLETLAVDAEIAIIKNKGDNIVKSIVAQQLNNISIPRQPNMELSTIKSLKNRIKDNNLTVSKADKGNTVVVLTRDNYITKVNDVIRGEDFSQLPYDPTKKFSAIIKLALKNSKFLFPTTSSRYRLIEMNPRPPLLYGLPKLHKDGFPIRPVVSYIGAPAYELSKSLNVIIKEKSKFESPYSLKNSLQLVNNIKDIILPPKAKLLSLDVESLFTNVPFEECITLISEMFEKHRLLPGEINEIIDFTRICMNQNYFKFNDDFYIQKDGLAMGSPLSPLMAEIFMNYFEMLNIVGHRHILYYFRYVDDIIICWTGTERQLDMFVNNLNKKHPKIKFKLEWENSNSLNFLDLTITRINSKHHFEIFRKPTYTDTTIPASSCHPWQHKIAAFNSYIHRLTSLPLSKESYKKELDIILQLALCNGYNSNMIFNLIKKKEKQSIAKLIYAVPPRKDFMFKSSLTYVGLASEKIQRYLKQNKINVAFRTQHSLRNILCNGKDKIDNKCKSGVYKLQCSDCNCVYVGQTGRNFESRYKEHISAFKNKHCDKSHFAKHLLETGHTLSADHSFEIIHTCNKGLKLNILEQLEIIKCNKNNPQTLLNDQTNVSNSPLLRILTAITSPPDIE